VALAAGVVSGGRGDWDEFVTAGKAMVGSAGLHVYVLHHEVQTGPLSLLLAWLFSFTPRDGFVLAAIVSAALGVLAIRLHELTARVVRGNTDFELLVLLGGCLTAFTWAKLGGYGHLDDAITLTCAVVALYEIRSGRPLSAGLAIGIAVIAKPWGIIFLPLTLATRPRDWRAPVISGAVAAVVWLPFIVGAPDSLKALRPTVNVAPDSVMALFGVTTDTMPDWMRVAQLVGCLAIVGVANATGIDHRRHHRRPHRHGSGDVELLHAGVGDRRVDLGLPRRSKVPMGDGHHRARPGSHVARAVRHGPGPVATRHHRSRDRVGVPPARGGRRAPAGRR
jgi:hypothetical protein